MKSFSAFLDSGQIDQVAAFVSEAFVACGDRNTVYHTPANGWPDHEARNGAAFPFVTGDIPIDADPSALDNYRREGLSIFTSTCVTCHEGRFQTASSPTLKLAAPRPDPMDFEGAERVLDFYREEEALADELEDFYEVEYERKGPHDNPPRLARLTSIERSGQQLYGDACASCHAADGTAKNWVGQFLQPPAPDMTQPAYAATFDRSEFMELIAKGRVGTSMPAFENVLTREDMAAIAAYVERAFIQPEQ